MANALLLIGSALALAGAIWLLVVAFRDSLAMGLGTLLVPFFAIYAMVRYWPESKYPVALNLGGTLLLILSLSLAPKITLASFTEQPKVSWAEKRNVRGGPVTGPLADSRRRAADAPTATPQQTPAASTRTSQSSTSTHSGNSARNNPPTFQRPGSPRGESFPASRIGDFVDRHITVIRTDGERILCTIEKVEKQTVTLRRRLGGGTISFKLERSEISELLVPRRIQ